MFKKLLTLILTLMLLQLPVLVTAQNASSNGVRLFTDDSSEDEFLSPDQAFQLNISTNDNTHISAYFKVASGYYLYKDRIKLSLADKSMGNIININLPKGETKNDPNFGKQVVYHHDFVAEITLANANKPTIKAIYQGCSEKGLCYAPQSKTFNLALADSTVANQTATDEDDDKTTQALKSGNLWLVVSLFFIAGLLLSFTPCVLPMIPILSSIILNSQSKQKQPSKLHAFGLSVAYVFGMALSYTLAGIAAGLSGSLISQALQNAWVLGATALIFVALAFSMFGFYELKLPAFIENKMQSTSQKLKGGEFLGVFLMGVLSALIVSPCVAAPLAGALIYIGQTHNVVLGGLGLFALAVGMGVPLLLIGASAGSLLPKAGGWMTSVRNLFGVVMIAMAVYIVWPVLSSNVKEPVQEALGVNTEHALPFTSIKSVAELDAAIANAQGKTVMLDFYADWCASCKEMESLTFSTEKVQTALSNTVLLQADVTANTADDQALLKRFGLFGPPGIIFFDRQGQEIKPKVVGFKNADDFEQVLKRVTK